MRHINPTLMAHTLPSGGACPTRAGTAQSSGDLELREAQLAKICQLEVCDLSQLTPLQRVQLSEMTRKTLDIEMSLLNHIVRQFEQAVNSEADATVLKRLADIMDLMGLTVSRTASVLRVESSVNTNGAEDPRIKEILEQLQGAMRADDPQKEGE